MTSSPDFAGKHNAYRYRGGEGGIKDFLGLMPVDPPFLARFDALRGELARAPRPRPGLKFQRPPARGLWGLRRRRGEVFVGSKEVNVPGHRRNILTLHPKDTASLSPKSIPYGEGAAQHVPLDGCSQASTFNPKPLGNQLFQFYLTPPPPLLRVAVFRCFAVDMLSPSEGLCNPPIVALPLPQTNTCASASGWTTTTTTRSRPPRCAPIIDM